MIVVIGSPLFRPGTGDRPSQAAGPPAGIAGAVSAAGGTVQLVGRVGEDPAGEATLLALAAAGIGHVAMLRDAARPTPVEQLRTEPDSDFLADALAEPAEPAEDDSSDDQDERATLDPGDVGLALSYLDGYRVIIVAEPLSDAALAVAAEAAAYTGARLVALVAQGAPTGPLPEGAIVMEAPVDDPDGVFARTVASFALALDQGNDPGAALEGAVVSAGWERSPD